MIKLVCLDMAGTTVQDGGVVKESFLSAGHRHGPAQLARRQRAMLCSTPWTPWDRARSMSSWRSSAATQRLPGKPTACLRQPTNGTSPPWEFMRSPVPPKPSARLREAGVKVVLTTGFSPVTRDRLITSLGWEELVDDALSPADAGRGRPAPDMILTAMLRFGIDDVREIAVAGDTTSDLLAGTRSGASIVAGVLTGAHTREDLQTAPHTHILNSVTELPGVLLS